MFRFKMEEIDNFLVWIVRLYPLSRTAHFYEYLYVLLLPIRYLQYSILYYIILYDIIVSLPNPLVCNN